MKSKEEKQHSAPATALQRVMSILNIVSERQGDPMRIVEVAECLDLPKSTVHRIVNMLLSLGLLSMSTQKGSVILGKNLVDMVLRALQTPDLHALLLPTFTRVANSVGATAFLARFDGNQVELIDIFPPTHEDIPYFNPGKGVRPAHACSSAKAILGFYDPAIVRAAVNSPMKHFTQSTIVDLDTYMAELSQVREQGFAECQEEMEQGVYSIAIPVFASKGAPEFSIGLAGPTVRMRLTEPKELKACLLGASREMSGWLYRSALIESQRMATS
mgnify:CR=1 FL=1